MQNEMARIIWSQAWQVTVLILVVGILLRYVGRNHPHFAHALWVVVLIKAITPPLWSSPSGVFSWLQSPTSTEDVAGQVEAPEPDNSPATEPVQVVPRKLFLEPDWDAKTARVLPDPASARGEWEPELANSPPVEEPVPPKTEALTAPAPSSPLSWKGVAVAVWFSGSLVSLLLTWGRWRSCRREIHRAERMSHPDAERLLEQLTTQLKIRRRVRLIISRSRIGPAVLGIVRPAVLIPARVIEGKTPTDLEPILAHELIHIRRGDLWIGWLQMVVQAVWWFHPLVWWAGRFVKHEAERCCDEEVVAELGCKPARYARALLDILELKQTLKPVPVLPGVKPVEITSQRLERIMLLRQGCRKRTPWWCWLVMLLAAVPDTARCRLRRVGQREDESKGR